MAVNAHLCWQFMGLGLLCCGGVFDRSGGDLGDCCVSWGGEAAVLTAFIPNLRRKKMVFRRIENRVSILVL